MKIKSIKIVKQEPEVALCSLAAIVICNIKDREQYKKSMYYALLMIDKCIHQAEYILPHVGFTAKMRLNAGVGITGLAYHMAKKNLKYTSIEGKLEMHRTAEMHSYLAIEQSLKLGKELGNAPWMHKTKWPEGWLPIDTYNRSVDEIANFTYEEDWEGLRAEVIANKGIRHSCLVAHMPCESSSKASGAPNCLYPVRALVMLKTDNETVIDWVAPGGDTIGDQYEIAWKIPTTDMIDCYAIYQKFADQGISADWWEDLSGDQTIGSSKMLKDYLHATKRGLKGRYYQNTLTSAGTNLNSTNTILGNTFSTLEAKVDSTVEPTGLTGEEMGDCQDGVCKM